MELQKELSAVLHLDLPTTFVFDYPSMGEMTAHLLTQLPDLPAPTPATPSAVPQENGKDDALSSIPRGAEAQQRYISELVRIKTVYNTLYSALCLRCAPTLKACQNTSRDRG